MAKKAVTKKKTAPATSQASKIETVTDAPAADAKKVTTSGIARQYLLDHPETGPSAAAKACVEAYPDRKFPASLFSSLKKEMMNGKASKTTSKATKKAGKAPAASSGDMAAMLAAADFISKAGGVDKAKEALAAVVKIGGAIGLKF